ncbi:uncharacterized protein LOC131659624 [Vicia villosa]|uniref:uncharacterized protein LOC131659624 n=1 Tax=Vicia villosa TaxID=3911 RepID=UPI00273A9747|nr:uncharacterized protein LOC131659624 [Vicia villosa]
MTMGCCRKCLPLFYFSSHTLTSLTITSGTGPFREFQNSLNFPSLTNLSLRFFAFHSSDDKGYVDPFSSFKCLNTLIIDRCSVDDEDNLSISSVTLVNLTIKTYGSYKFELSTPNLCSFDFTGNPIQKLNKSNNNFSSIKHVHIDVHIGLFDEKHPLILLNWLTQLGLIESLTVSSKTLEILDLVRDLWIIDFPCLHNLKSLRIKMYKHLPIPHGVDDFLLQNAPSAEKSVIDLSYNFAFKFLKARWRILPRYFFGALVFPRDWNKLECNNYQNFVKGNISLTGEHV